MDNEQWHTDRQIHDWGSGDMALGRLVGRAAHERFNRSITNTGPVGCFEISDRSECGNGGDRNLVHPDCGLEGELATRSVADHHDVVEVEIVTFGEVGERPDRQ